MTGGDEKAIGRAVERVAHQLAAVNAPCLALVHKWTAWSFHGPRDRYEVRQCRVCLTIQYRPRSA